MAINYCTIGSTTVDGFCGLQRAKVLARLIDEAGHGVVNPPTPQPHGHGGTGGITHGPTPGYRPPTFPQYRPPEVERDPYTYEQPIITVTAEIFEFRGSETQETTVRLDFVTVSDLEFNSEPVVTVNITEMEI